MQVVEYQVRLAVAVAPGNVAPNDWQLTEYLAEMLIVPQEIDDGTYALIGIHVAGPEGGQ